MTTLKARLVARVMQRIRDMEGDQALDNTKCQTALRKLGMQPGNAQRLLDEASDVQISRVSEAARMLGVPAHALLADTAPSTQPAPAVLDLAAALPVVLDALLRMPRQQRQAMAADWAALLAAPDSAELAAAVEQAMGSAPTAMPEQGKQTGTHG